MKKKITLYLTDIALHHRNFREAKKLDKTIKQDEHGRERGRIYTNDALTKTPDGQFQYEIRLPEELQRQINAGEVDVEFMMPEGGIPIFLGKDGIEKATQLRKKTRLKLARSGQIWKKV